MSPLHKAEEHRVGLHLRGPERTGEGHIHLSWRKGPGAEIEAHIIQGQTLGLVDGDGPCGEERYLPVGPDLPVLDALAFLIPLLPNFRPLRTRDEVHITASVEAHENPTLVDALHGAE